MNFSFHFYVNSKFSIINGLFYSFLKIKTHQQNAVHPSPPATPFTRFPTTQHEKPSLGRKQRDGVAAH